MDKLTNVKKSLELTAKIYDGVKAAIGVGVSEQDIYDLCAARAGELCKGHEYKFVGDFVSGERTGAIGGPPSERVMNRGDLFILDFSLYYDGYWGDVCRTFFLGEPTGEQKKVYDTVLRCQANSEQKVHAGIIARDIKAEMDNFMEANGYGGLMPHHAGHAVGDGANQPPDFNMSVTDTVRDGEIITLEPGLYYPGKWGERVENDYLVAGDRLINLFEYPKNIEYFIV